MSDETPEQSVSEGEMDLWYRIIGRRRAEWSSLPRNELAEIVRPLWTEEASQIDDPWQQTEFILNKHFNISVNRHVNPKNRRRAWHTVNGILQNLDKSRARVIAGNHHNSNNAVTASSPKTSQPPLVNSISAAQKAASSLTEKKKPPNSSRTIDAPRESSSTNQEATSVAVQAQSNPQTKQTPAPSQQRQNSTAVPNEPVALSCSLSSQQKEPPIQQRQQAPPAQSQTISHPSTQQTRQQKQKEPPAQQRQQRPAARSEPVAISSAKPATAGVVPARATPTPPTNSVTSRRPEVSKGTNVGSKGSAFSSTATKMAPAAAAKKTVSRPLAPVSISFGADTQRYAAAVDKNGRSSVRVTFQPREISNEEYNRTVERLERWEPFWSIQRIISIVETFPINRLENLKTGTKPLQATECTVKLNPKDAAKVRDWGKANVKGKRYMNGETRLLVRMLPVRLGQKKRPRADTHLWPKGTFVQLGGMSVFIDQRRQQQHDPKEWKSMSTPLDLSSLLRNPTSANKLQLYFLDNEPYILCVALCSYVAPEPLNNIVWSKDVQKLSMEEAKAKALENANRQTVVLEDTTSSNEMSSFIFPLSCPVSQQLIDTPVRGNTCNHWQCFELRNFVESNTHVTGTRWECPVCTKILSLRDLQYCPLTASILKEYSKEATPHRDRVQFFANGTWKLLDEAKKRYSKKRQADGDNVNGNKKARTNGTVSKPKPSSPEVIELE